MARVQIAVATLSVKTLRQTVHTHRVSVHQAAKLVAALLRVAGVTSGLAESNGSLAPGLWLTSPAGWLPRTWISSGTLRWVVEYGLPLPLCTYGQLSKNVAWQIRNAIALWSRRRFLAHSVISAFNGLDLHIVQSRYEKLMQRRDSTLRSYKINTFQNLIFVFNWPGLRSYRKLSDFPITRAKGP